jgi:predicted ATPase
MKSFEYCSNVVEFDSTSYHREVTATVEKSIEQYAELGWELVCVAHEGAYKRVLYFKREVASYEKV